MLESLVPEPFRKTIQRRAQPPASQKKERKDGAKSLKTGQAFTQALDNKAQDQFEQDIDEFLSEIEGLEKTLLDSPCKESVDSYRNSIGGFLKKVSKNYAPFEFYSRKRKVCKIWRVMDQQLNDLYKGVVSGQLKGLMLLDRLHEIKGLIVDLKVGGE